MAQTNPDSGPLNSIFPHWNTELAGRVSHFGFTNNNATEGWTNRAWTAYDENNPSMKDEAINLNFFFDFLDPGASVSFSFVYILQIDDLLTAIGEVRYKGVSGGYM